MKYESNERGKGDGDIDSCYQKGLLYAAEAALLSFRPSRKKEERLYDVSEIVDYQNLAKEQLIAALSLTGTCEEQRIKIKAALLLVKFAETPEEKKGYFYDAVEIATRYLGQDFYDTDEGRAIVKGYLISIDPNFQTQFIDTQVASFLPLLRLILRAESERRIAEKKIIAQKNREDSIHITSHDEILLALAASIGPFRLHILSEESDTCIADHHMTDHPMTSSETLTFRIFDRWKKYRIRIDRGSNEKENQFSPLELRESIYPFLERYIKMKEHTFFVSVMDNLGVIDVAESQMTPVHSMDEYRPFIAHVMADFGARGLFHDDGESVENCCQAIDICQTMSLSYKQGSAYKGQDPLEKIEEIFSGDIHRKVLHMVTSLLLSRNETVDATGYPYGLGRKDIPLEGRIYTIIRAYEALREVHIGNHKKVLSMMNEWAEWGYFDPDILPIFLGFFSDSKVSSAYKDNPEKEYVLSPRRKAQYEFYRDKWYRLMDTMRKIEDGYDAVRQNEGDRAKQNALFLNINKLQLRLRREADLRNIILLSRHGATESDTPSGPPGHDDEVLTESGELSSLKKGEFLEGLRLSLATSPLLRAGQTAKIICQKVRKCAEACLSCPHITKEEVLRNPPKSQDNGRYNSYIQKILADNTGGLLEFLIRSVSSPREEMRLLITHRDLGRHVIFWLQNLFSEEGIVGEKNSFGNEKIYEFFFRGDHVLSESEMRIRGLLFPLHSWKGVIEALGQVTLGVFGERYISRSPTGVNLIELHDAFLDFLDRYLDNQREKVGEFFSRLEGDPRLCHMLGILQGEGFALENQEKSEL